MSVYYNGAGQCLPLFERPLEPPDCWGREQVDSRADEYDRTENELNERFNRY